MNNNLAVENEQLKQRIAELEEELQKTKEHLKKYTAPSYKKEYYEKNRETILAKAKEKLKTSSVSQEKRREYNRIAYLKRKEKLQINKISEKYLNQ